MTHDEIDAMPAGRELDILVAEKVMGCYGLFKHSDGTPLCECHGLRPVPRYSTDIAAAWEVLKKLPNGVYVGYEKAAGAWCVAANWADGEPFSWLSYGKTAPLAICRAALKAAAK